MSKENGKTQLFYDSISLSFKTSPDVFVLTKDSIDWN